MFEPRHPHLVPYMDEVLVVCPACRQVARVSWSPGKLRFSCDRCGSGAQPAEAASRRDADGAGAQRGAVDPHYGLALALRTGFKRHELWFYNQRHLADVLEWVSKDHRARAKVGPSLWTRLPRWMRIRSNRLALMSTMDELARAIEADLGELTPPA